MSEWNYTKCSKLFKSLDEALKYMITNSFDGQVLERTEGYSAVCPTYPDGFYTDATPVAEYSPEAGVITDASLFGRIMTAEKAEEDADCYSVAVRVTTDESKCC